MRQDYIVLWFSFRSHRYCAAPTFLTIGLSTLYYKRNSLLQKFDDDLCRIFPPSQNWKQNYEFISAPYVVEITQRNTTVSWVWSKWILQFSVFRSSSVPAATSLMRPAFGQWRCEAARPWGEGQGQEERIRMGPCNICNGSPRVVRRSNHVIQTCIWNFS